MIPMDQRMVAASCFYLINLIPIAHFSVSERGYRQATENWNSAMIERGAGAEFVKFRDKNN